MDRDALGEFYAGLFGWHTESFPDMQYVTIDTHAGGGINGGIGPLQGEMPPALTLYAQVEDLQATLDKATAAGGTTIMEPTDVPGAVSLAIFLDIQGRATGLVKNISGQDNGVSQGTNPGVTWFEILGPDPKALEAFYGAVLGWEFAEMNPDSQIEYYEVQGDERAGGGIGASPDGESHVTAYAEVDDVSAYLQSVESLGGKTVMPPTSMGNVTYAQFSDPEGVIFGLFSRS